MRPLLVTVAVFATLTAAATAPGTRADAAAPNWLDRECGSHVTTSCVVAPLDVDALTAHRALTFRDGAGHRVTVAKRAAVWRLAVRHSPTCRLTGGQHDLHGCHYIDRQTGLGRSIVLHDGTAVTMTFFRP